jgi:hypothetical protein
VSERGVAIGVEKSLTRAQRPDESVVEPAASIIANDFAVAPAGKVRQFVNQNECGKFI